MPPDDVPVRDDVAFDAAFKDWSNREAVQVFAPFTGPIGALYEGVKAWLSRDWWGVGLAAAGALPIGKFGGLGYHSFNAFKRAQGKAGDGMQWHHIVEQNPANKARFSPYQLHNVDNLVRIDRATHNKINAHYSSNLPGTQTRVRDVLSPKSFDEQYEYGLNVLREHGTN